MIARPILWTAAAVSVALAPPTGARGQEAAPPWYDGLQAPLEWIDRSDGLSHNSAFALLQDHQGFLWIGTADGLNRYDGRSFQVFRHAPSDPGSLANSTVRTLHEDRDHRLWVGTGAGVNRFDRSTGGFRRYAIGSGVFLEDSAGTMWVANDDGVHRHDPGSDTFVRVGRYPPGRESVTPWGFVESGGGSWVLHRNGALEAFSDSGAVLRVDSLPYPESMAVGKDAAGVPLIGSELGVHRLDLSGAPTVGDARPLSALGLTSRPLDRLVDRQGREWWAGGGLARAPIPGATATPLWSGGGPGSLNTVWSLAEDSDGSVWAATLRGLLRFDAFPRAFGHSRARFDPGLHDELGPVMSLGIDLSGDLLLGTLGTGLRRIGARDGRITDPLPAVPDPPRDVWALAPDEDGRTWLGTSRGVGRYDPQGGTVRWYPLPTGGSGRQPAAYTLARSGDGTIWIGAVEGLFWLEPATGASGRVELPRVRQGPLRVESLRTASDGRVWVGTSHSDVYEVDPESRRPTHHPVGDPPVFRGSEGLWAAAEDAAGRPWFGGDRGLGWFDEAAGAFHLLGPDDGVPETTVYSMVRDGSGDFWVSTNVGLLRIDDPRTFPGEALSVRLYPVGEDVAESEFNRRAALRTASGSILFGGIDGVTFFDPDGIADNPNPPSVVIDRVERIRPSGIEGIPAYGATEAVTAYGDAGFDIHFAAPSYAGTDVQFAVLLEGLDPEWYDPGGPRVRYMGVPPGDYTFRVRARSGDGIWNESGASLAIVVPPPFWDTLWFRLLVGSTALAALVAAVRAVSTRRLRARIRSLELERSVRAERDRIYRDLHDHLGAHVSGIVSGIELVRLSAAAGRPDETAEHLDELDGDARRTLAELRDTVWSLRQERVTWADFCDRLGTYLADRQRHVATPRLLLEVEGPGTPPLNPGQALGLFRVVQESITNAVRHAGARVVTVRVRGGTAETDGLELTVSDDGTYRREEVEAGLGVGIGSMRARLEELGGRFRIGPNDDGGTTVAARIPASGYGDVAGGVASVSSPARP